LVNIGFERVAHPQVQPNPTQDLFELYSLNPIANSVARALPNGEKNKLRKTYKGKIKDLGINGKFDVVVREDEAPDALLTMLKQPEEEWTAQNCTGKEIEKGIPSQIRANIAAAMTMAKGTIPRSSWDSSVLGELDLPEKKISTIPAPNKLVATAAVPKGSNLNPVPRNPKLDLARPKRNVKKRGYEDSSFEGYGEGYVDDDIVDAGYSTAEGDERGMSQKRRKKVCIDRRSTTTLTNCLQSATSNAYPGPMRHNSYGPGMVGA
jgi:Rox3 mediator complex subunit